MRIPDARRVACERLRTAGVPWPELDLDRLFAFATGRSPSAAMTDRTDRLDAGELLRLERAIERRVRREPVSHIVGYRDFWNHRFAVTPDVLDPRPESESVVAAAIELGPRRVLDLGTGSGCLLLSILGSCPGASGQGTDVSEKALKVARGNAELLGLEDQAAFSRSDWFAGVCGVYDLIVANPPYVSAEDYEKLEPEVRVWEPAKAITTGGDGLEVYRLLAADAAGYLAHEGKMLLELGAGQSNAVSGIFEKNGFTCLRVVQDLDGRDRVLIVGRPD